MCVCGGWDIAVGTVGIKQIRCSIKANKTYALCHMYSNEVARLKQLNKTYALCHMLSNEVARSIESNKKSSSIDLPGVYALLTLNNVEHSPSVDIGLETRL